MNQNTLRNKFADTNPHKIHSRCIESKSDLGPGQVGLLARPGPAEAEAVKASVWVGPGETEGARFAGGALHALHVGLARAVAVGIAAAVAVLVALVLQGPRGVAVAGPAEREAA